MNISAPFIRRPIATVLLTAALLVGGIVGYNLLPVAALPNVDFPTIMVSATLPGASPEIMASSVAQPLERQFADLPGVNQITSSSVQGVTSITLQFDLSRNIDGAAADVQAAINAASGLLPKQLPNPPTYKKVNPADQPVLLLGLTSDLMTLQELDQYADLELAQRISMLPDVGQVVIFGEQKYAPTVQLNPTALAARGIGMDDVATAISNNTVEQPAGALQGPQEAYQIGANSQLLQVDQLAKVIVAYRDGAPVRIQDLGRVVEGSDVPLQLDWVNKHIGEMVGIWRQPGSNALQLVKRIKEMLPRLEAGLPPSINLAMVSDRSVSISASFADVKLTLVLTIVLVVLVVFIFLRSFWATVIPSIAVPLSLAGTFAVMYLCGYSLDNLSLMGLSLAVGLIVDDAIVMLENIYRYLEQGNEAVPAALKGAGEIGFTVASITISFGGLHSAVVHGRRPRPAVPRVRRNGDRCNPAFGRHCADLVANACSAFPPGPAISTARAVVPLERAHVPAPVAWLPTLAEDRSAFSPLGDAAQPGADRGQRLAARHHTQRLSARRRHGADFWLHRGLA
jgi:multidrug efflux pump subunit AcrB